MRDDVAMTHSARHYRGERASTLFSPLAFDAEAGLFLHDDESLGFGFLCTPLSGVEESTAELRAAVEATVAFFRQGSP